MLFSMPVMIMAAGRGERMQPLTDTMPKPLLEVGGKPLIAHHLERLSAAGFSQVVVNLAYRGEQIEQWLGDGAAFGLRVRYSREGSEPLETGGGILHALPLLGPGPFLVVNGDVFTDYPFAELGARKLRKDELAHLVMVPNPPQHPDGDFVLDGERLSVSGSSTLTYSGIGIYRAELLAAQKSVRFPLAPLLKAGMQAGRVSGELYEGVWDDIGTPERLRKLDQQLLESSRREALLVKQ